MQVKIVLILVGFRIKSFAHLLSNRTEWLTQFAHVMLSLRTSQFFILPELDLIYHRNVIWLRAFQYLYNIFLRIIVISFDFWLFILVNVINLSDMYVLDIGPSYDRNTILRITAQI